MSKSAEQLRSVAFPKCSDKCSAVHLLGLGECESMCPYKFDTEGEPVSWNKEDEDRYWTEWENTDLGILGGIMDG